MSRKKITKKTLAVSIDVEIEQKLREIAKAESRSISYIVEKSIGLTIARFNFGEDLFDVTTKQEKRLQKLEHELKTYYTMLELMEVERVRSKLGLIIQNPEKYPEPILDQKEEAMAVLEEIKIDTGEWDSVENEVKESFLALYERAEEINADRVDAPDFAKPPDEESVTQSTPHKGKDSPHERRNLRQKTGG